ncbi:hypothetical protein TGRUB_288730 [Toxoplasma gondii RUB]|uniref:DNA-directed DNA polymerase X domain-containing protein n=1 Tax=Toxoplasma gondii RUB TaxID=935652 RepID=A0A086M128_TOXGO|nr:hypothetical protein TGRUB_288730 [Toxoplasma gondii RUB]
MERETRPKRRLCWRPSLEDEEGGGHERESEGSEMRNAARNKGPDDTEVREQGREEDTESADEVEVTAVVLPLATVLRSSLESLAAERASPPSFRSCVRTFVCSGVIDETEERQSSSGRACSKWTAVGEEARRGERAKEVAEEDLEREKKRQRGGAEQATNVEEPDAERGEATEMRGSRKRNKGQGVAQGEIKEREEDAETDLFISSSDTECDELRMQEGVSSSSFANPENHESCSSSPSPALPPSSSALPSPPSASSSALARPSASSSSSSFPSSASTSSLSSFAPSSSSFRASSSSSRSASAAPGGRPPATGDLTDFVVEKLQLLASKYEEHGEVWRAMSFRVASGVLRQCSGAAFRAAEQARRRAVQNSSSAALQQTQLAPASPTGKRSEIAPGCHSSAGDASSSHLASPPSSSPSASPAVSPSFSSAVASSRSPLSSSARARLRREGITRENYALLKHEPGIGASIFQTVEELVLTGTTRRLQLLLHGERSAAREELQSVWGVGFHTAEKLIALDVCSVSDLRRVVAKFLSPPQQLSNRTPGPEAAVSADAIRADAGEAREMGVTASEKKTETDESASRRQTLLHSLFDAEHVDTYLETGKAGGRGRKPLRRWAKVAETPERGVHTPQRGVQTPEQLPGEGPGEDGAARPRISSFFRGAKEGDDPMEERRQQEAARLLSRPQLIGLKHVEAFRKRIPREEVAAVAAFVRRELGLDSIEDKATESPGGRWQEATNVVVRKRTEREQREDEEGRKGETAKEVKKGAVETADDGSCSWTDGLVGMDVCGSYRRGKAECGDIDILLIRRDDVPEGLLQHVVARLTSCGLLVDHLLLNAAANSHFDTAGRSARAQGERSKERSVASERRGRKLSEEDKEAASKMRSSRHSGAELYCGVCVWPPWPTDGNAIRFVGPRLSRRIDIKIYPERSRAYALLYFTGAAQFNRSMRLWAKNRSLLLDDTGCYPRGLGTEALQRRKASRKVQDDPSWALSPTHESPEETSDDTEGERSGKDAEKGSPECVGAPNTGNAEAAERDAAKKEAAERDVAKKEAAERDVAKEESTGGEEQGGFSHRLASLIGCERRGNAAGRKGGCVHCSTEKEIFDLLGLQFVPPEDREAFVHPKDATLTSYPSSSQGSE